jgi:hypothetical protein
MPVIIGKVKAKKIGVKLQADTLTTRLIVCCDKNEAGTGIGVALSAEIIRRDVEL